MFVSNDWDRLVQGKEIKVAPLNEAVTAKFVFFKDRETDSYGEFYEGDSEVYVIFEVDGKFYKKIGYKSSYGYEISWAGDPVEVQPKTKTIQVFE